MFTSNRFRLFFLGCATALMFGTACGDDSVAAERAQARGERSAGISDFNEEECASMCEQMAGTCAMEVFGSADDCMELCGEAAFTDLDFACLVDTPCGVIQTECFDDSEPTQGVPQAPPYEPPTDDDTIRF